MAKLRAKSGLDARVVSEVNKQRLGVLLKKVSQRDRASLDKQEKRWRDALDGRTTGDADGTTKRQFGWKRKREVEPIRSSFGRFVEELFLYCR